MSKINTANILKGLNNVVNITSSLTNTAKDEMIPVDQIELCLLYTSTTLFSNFIVTLPFLQLP